MAAFLKNTSRFLFSQSSALFSMTSCKMTVFAPFYVEPIFKKDKLNEMIESGEINLQTPVAVKPALMDQSSSSLQDETVRKFTNLIMKMGKKELARNLLERTFEKIKRTQIERYHLAPDEESKEAIELNPVSILHQAIENARPIVDLMPVKRGGAKYQVPVPLRVKRSYFISMRWLINAARERDNRKTFFPDQLADELLDAANNRGKVIKKKQDLHRQCEANRAYAHYRWS